MDKRDLVWDRFSRIGWVAMKITHVPSGLFATSCGKSVIQVEREAMERLEQMYDGWLHAQEASEA